MCTTGTMPRRDRSWFVICADHDPQFRMHVICRLIAKLNHDRESVYHLQVILSPVSLNIQALLMSKHCIERTERFDRTFIHAIHSKQNSTVLWLAMHNSSAEALLTFYNCFIKSVMFARILIGINSPCDNALHVQYGLY